MKSLFPKFAKTLATAVTLSVAIAVDAPQSEAISLIQKDLFFGRNISGDGEVSEKDFANFVDDVITPRFPAGLTIFDADGQFRDSTNTIIEEQSKVVTLLFEDTQENETAIAQVIEAYIDQFNQESVLLVIDEDVAVAFDASTTTVPEPSSVLGILTFAVLGASMLKRKVAYAGSPR